MTTPNTISRRTALGMAGVLLAGATVAARAQAPYPSRPVRLIVPFPAGTSPDVIARLWGDEFAKATGQPVVVENRSGASTIIGAQTAASAPADGYTLLWTVNNTFSINPYVYKKLPYKAEDFVPVTRILSVPYVLVTSNESKIRSLQDLVREAKARPDAMTYASAGIGQGTHVAMARLLNQAGVSMTHVPYKDYFLPDVIAQRVDVAFDASTGAIPQVKAGKVRALGVSSPHRIEGLPDVPAIAEIYPGFVGDSWHGIFAPKGTPQPALAVLLANSQRIVSAADFRAKLQGYGLTPVGEPPEAFRRFLDEDARAWAKVVKDNKIAAE
ncbi:tripartite tricarboxylate transporter substrate binding protein [Variovorax sp. YR216]|uniref:Bug family tripartite tricarboxylate transporter substrate binding protein n=1 Tax=Variovorax sp. YR216 TaxID=1882828 RepID=UPI000899CA8A|nr:tripartite tricarboxylate transporter substrate binding protein [Variovorax sp. YR216]SEB18805.1 Tripartite-type tricarboxylate transporter, receptor component TctC [Variovorax sp. YR216]